MKNKYYLINVRSKSANAVLWSVADVFMRQGIKYVIAIGLARILKPSDFGVIAMVYVFIGIATTFIDSGFSSALIQKQDVTLRDESTVFYFNILMGLFMSLALCASASWIAMFFKQPVLRLITILMALNVLVSSFGSIHNTLLMKKMDFKILMKIGVVASSLSGMLALLLALKGFGVWSLVWQTLLSSAITVILLWVWHPWRPKYMFSLKSIRKLFRFGSFLMFAALLETLYSRLHAILIGKLFSATDLGYYSRALSTRQMQAGVMETAINRITFPVLSKSASNKDKLLKDMKKILLTMMFINVPVMLGMVIVARPFVITLFGEKWLRSVPILQVLCLAGVLWPLHTVNIKALNAQGRSDLFFKIEIVKKIIGVSAIIIASFYGIMAIAWSQVITGIIAFIINAYYSWKFLEYGLWEQVRGLIPSFGAGVIMMSVMWALREITHLQVPLELLLLIACGIIIYLLCAKLFKVTAFSIVLENIGLFKKK